LKVEWVSIKARRRAREQRHPKRLVGRAERIRHKKVRRQREQQRQRQRRDRQQVERR
jgi:hypothetical protein